MLDVTRHTLGLDEIRQYVHPTDSRRPENVAHQRRVLRRWETDRARLEARYGWDPEQVADWQLDRIRIIVETAYATHPFYHALYRSVGYQSGDLVDWKDYHALPAISKSDIVDNFELFTSNRALPVEDVYVSRTSGSSGKVLEILQDEATADANHVFYLRHYDRLLRRHREPAEWLYEIYLVPQRYSSLDGAYPAFTVSQACPVDLAVAHIRRVRPAILSAFPSYLLRMVDSGTDLRDMGIGAICTNSETSSRQERRLISEAFGAPVHDEYSSEELYLIAIECPESRYHIVQDNVRVDTIGEDSGGSGEIVGTSLVNTYMPFIRYRQGDVIRFANDGAPCSCGNRFAALAEFQGRTDQFLRRSDGTAVPPDQVMGIYDATLLTGETGVAEFQLIQDSTGAIEVLVRPTTESVATHEPFVDRFCRELTALINDEAVVVRWRQVDAMPPAASHKRRLITSHFDPTGELVRDAVERP